MKIRTRLALIFILLMVFGVTAVSSFSILYIRAFLLESGVEDIVEDAEWMKQTINQVDSETEYHAELLEIARSARYHLQIFEGDGERVFSGPEEAPPDEHLPGYVREHFDRGDETLMLDDERDDERIVVFGELESSLFPGGWFSISQDEELLYEPVATMRWIIYTGMFISIGLILIVSTVVARSISRPIVELSRGAGRIADGEVTHTIQLNRNDEFGELAGSINRMADHLRADNERLLQINERQRQFFADIAHEIRNPLHTLMGSLEMLELDKLDTPTRKQYVANARGQADRLSQLLTDILTLQRIDHDKYFIEKTSFDLAGVIPEVVSGYQPLVEDKGLTLDWDTHSCMVFADRAKIEQVMDNLVSNAVKFTNEGGVEVRYHAEDQSVYVAVSDTGIGIPQQHHSRLFDRFYRTDKARSRDKGGTGLGLAVVRNILDAHNQQIGLESEPGRGSRFYFRLDKA